MIPRHAPPFGFASLLVTAVAARNVGPAELEQYCAEQFAVANAVLLPSARAGLLLAIEALGGVDARVSTSAFTCGVVYQALALSGRAIQYLDLPASGFLADIEMMQESAGNPGVVLAGEIYGIRYSSERVAQAGGDRATPWIWDLAMCIPDRNDMSRLRDKDVAVVSFGLGKCMYAGWGGVALTHDANVAEQMRERRDRQAKVESGTARKRHAASLFLRTALHNRAVYGGGRMLADWRQRRSNREATVPSSEPSLAPMAKLDPEWTEPMTPLNRKLVVRNLRQAASSIALREQQAVRYFDCLAPLGVVRGISRDRLPQSHFPIRVPTAGRHELRNALHSLGIDTATYFPFPRFLSKDDYPNTALTAAEVVLLPMGECIKLEEVDWVAKQAARRLAGQVAR